MERTANAGDKLVGAGNVQRHTKVSRLYTIQAPCTKQYMVVGVVWKVYTRTGVAKVPRGQSNLSPHTPAHPLCNQINKLTGVLCNPPIIIKEKL